MDNTLTPLRSRPVRGTEIRHENVDAVAQNLFDAEETVPASPMAAQTRTVFGHASGSPPPAPCRQRSSDGVSRPAARRLMF